MIFSIIIFAFEALGLLKSISIEKWNQSISIFNHLFHLGCSVLWNKNWFALKIIPVQNFIRKLTFTCNLSEYLFLVVIDEFLVDIVYVLLNLVHEWLSNNLPWTIKILLNKSVMKAHRPNSTYRAMQPLR